MEKNFHKYDQLWLKQKKLWNLVNDELQCTVILSWVYHNNTAFLGKQPFSKSVRLLEMDTSEHP